MKLHKQVKFPLASNTKQKLQFNSDFEANVQKSCDQSRPPRVHNADPNCAGSDIKPETFVVWLTNGFMLHFYITGGKVHVCRAEGCCTRSTLTVTCSKVRKKKGKPAEDMNLKSDTDAYDGPYTCYITSQTPNSCWSNTLDPNIHPQTWRSIFIQHKYRRCVGEPGLCGIRRPNESHILTYSGLHVYFM